MLTFLMMTTVDSPDASLLDALLMQIAAGDRRALGDFYRATHQALYGYTLSVVKHTEDAQDVLHDCYMSVCRHAPTYRSQGKPMAWLYTIARNLCIQQLRDRKRTEDLCAASGEMWLPVRDDITADERVMLTACMQRLSDEERQIVVLHAVAGFRHREIASLLSLPLSTVLSKYSRSLKKLKTAIEGGDLS